ncbi:GM26643 [Drosophila sechellia]|uniref:GM26643 n=1 Tax=Drosophila sechellia TaxID=7238 RepID=B4HHN5_DROSE|nr:GM26643 [Drosophila sechellia]
MASDSTPDIDECACRQRHEFGVPPGSYKLQYTPESIGGSAASADPATSPPSSLSPWYYSAMKAWNCGATTLQLPTEISYYAIPGIGSATPRRNLCRNLHDETGVLNFDRIAFLVRISCNHNLPLTKRRRSSVPDLESAYADRMPVALGQAENVADAAAAAAASVQQQHLCSIHFHFDDG